jgi:zinc-ribbon domain
MASDQSDREDAREKTDRTAEELGRKAARLLRRTKPRVEQAIQEARPRVERAVNQAKPQAERAAKGAWRYAQTHEEEIKRAAVKGARMRVRGPFGFLIDALQTKSSPEQPPTVCPSCSTPYQSNARFCSECGTRLTGATS